MGANEAIAYARNQIGKPYIWATEGPNSFDCSGLTFAACRAGGVHVGRTTYEQIFNGSEVRRPELQPGDLVFPDIGHVQLYVGENRVIESPHSGAYVREAQMWGFWRARRVFLDAGISPVPTPGAALPTANVGLPGSDLLSRLPVLGQLEKLAETLNAPTFWRRVGLGSFALLLVMIGISFLARHQIEAAAVKTAETGVKAAKIASVI